MKHPELTAWAMPTLSLFSLPIIRADTNPTLPPSTDCAAWMNESRFGMFIHWGLYAEVARGE